MHLPGLDGRSGKVRIRNILWYRQAPGPVARFLNRIIFCLFAEDIGLLPKEIFSDLAKKNIDEPHFFAESFEELFRKMVKGGTFGPHKIRRFDGHLFEDFTVFELTPDEIRAFAEASESRWEFIEPKIMGTLFERALDPEGLETD